MNSQTQIFSIYHGLRLAAIPLVLMTLISMGKGAIAQEAAADSSSGGPSASASSSTADASPNSTPPPLDSTPAPDAEEKADLEVDPIDPKRQKPLSLFIGLEQQEKLPFFPPDAKFKGDYKKVTKVLVDKEQGILLFQPNKVGYATLTIYDANDRRIYDFMLDVRESDLTKVSREIRALLSDIEGITIKIVNNKVVVDGQVLLPRDLARITAVVDQFGPRAASLVNLSPMAQRKIAKLILEHINLPDVNVYPVNDKFVLEGTVDNEQEAKRAKQIAEMYLPDLVKDVGADGGRFTQIRRTFVLDLLKIREAPPKEPSKIIQIVVHFVELSKSYSKAFRFQFTPELKDDASNITISNNSQAQGGMVSSITAVISNLLPKLNWAKEHGHARILESSTLLVTDGSEGVILNQTAIPFTSFGPNNSAVSRDAKIGIRTKIGARINNPRSDAIEMAMDFSLAQLVDMSASGPITSESNVNTRVTVRSRQSAAIGGLIRNVSNTGYNKLPENVKNPIISLYASKQFTRKQSQFVVFVTPVIKVSASEGSEKVKKKFNFRD